MEEPLQVAEAVRQACMAVALQAYAEAELSGLYQEGRWEEAVEPCVGCICARESRHCMRSLLCHGVFLRARAHPDRSSAQRKTRTVDQAEASGASGTVPILSREMPSDDTLGNL